MNIKLKAAAALALAVLVLPGVSLAQAVSTAQLQAQIQSLMAQLQALEAQATAQSGSATNTAPSSSAWCYAFNTNLAVGMSGAAVTALQTALQKDGESVTVTGTFDEQTAAAVTAFQEKYSSTTLAPYGLKNGTGYAGKGTRTELNALFGCNGSTPITISTPVPPVVGAPIISQTLAAPVVTSVTAAGASPTPGQSAFVLGSGFDANSIVVFDGTQVTTAYISSVSLQFVVPSSASIGNHTVSVTEKAGANSNTITVVVVAATPVQSSTAQTAAPYFSLAGGVYPNTSSQTLTLTDTTPGAKIYYTTNGVMPTTASAVYTGPIAVNSTESVIAIAVAPGYSASPASAKSYTFAPQAPAPYFSLAGGTYSTPQTLMLSDIAGATIYYRTDGTTPNTASTLYSGPITINSTETVTAIAIANGYAQSVESAKAYTFTGTSTVPTARLTASINAALGTQAIPAGTTNVKIGSYAFTASPVEGVNIDAISMQLEPGTTANAFQNIRLMVNGVQYGATQGVISPGNSYAFTGSTFTVPAGGTVIVDVYADSLSNAVGTYAPATVLAGYIGIAQTSFTSVTATTNIPGQSVTFSGAPTLTVAIDASNPPAGQIVQNSTGNTLAVFRFTNTSNVENVTISQLHVVDAVANSVVKAAFSNVKLYNGSILLGTTAAPVLDAAGTGYIYAFNAFSSPLIVPVGNSVSLTLKGDAGSFTSGSITDGSMQTFGITTTGDATNSTPALVIVARGASSNQLATVTLSNAIGNSQTVLRTVLSLSGTSITNLPPASFQQIGAITFTANSAGDAEINSLKLTSNSTNAAFLATLALRDTSGNNVVSLGYAKSAVVGNAVTWTFSPSSQPIVLTAGSSYTYTVWGDLSQIPAMPSIAQSLTLSINATTDFSYYDGTNSTPILVNLPPTQVPFTVTSMISPVGGQF